MKCVATLGRASRCPTNPLSVILPLHHHHLQHQHQNTIHTTTLRHKPFLFHNYNMAHLDADPTLPLLRSHLTPLPPLSESTTTLNQFFSSFAADGAKVILIGDASHGTSEFYTARAVLTRHLIENHGFNIVAVEADWPDAEAVDRYVRHRPGLKARVAPGKDTGDRAFFRFPTWMCEFAQTPFLTTLWLSEGKAHTRLKGATKKSNASPSGYGRTTKTGTPRRRTPSVSMGWTCTRSEHQ